MIGEWIILAGGLGNSLAIDKDIAAASSPDRLIIWKNEKKIITLLSKSLRPGNPRIWDDKVFWGEGYVDLNDGKYKNFAPVSGSLSAVLERKYFLPGELFVPMVFAWEDTGKMVAVSLQPTEINGDDRPSVELIMAATGDTVRIWKEPDIVPRSLCVYKSCVFLGTRPVRKCDFEGKVINTFHCDTQPFKVECCNDERSLVIAEHSAITIWDTESNEMSRQWYGQWLDAAVSPDGKNLAMIDFEGKLHWVKPNDPQASLERIDLPDPVQSIALSNDWIMAAFINGERIRKAHLVS